MRPWRGAPIRVGLALLAIVVVLGAVGAAVWWKRRPPDIIFLVVDTLRADRLGAYGNRRGLTPFLDQLAADGTRFARAYSTSSWTNPAVASLFTSRYPSQYGLADYDSRLPLSEVTLAERLGEAGYIRLGFSANLRLTEDLGFGQGFQAWFPYIGENGKERVERIVRDALGFMDELKITGGRRTFYKRWIRQPVFLYLHFMEPHAPYMPPEPWRSRFGVAAKAATSDGEANAKLIVPGRWPEIAGAELDLLQSLYDAEVATLDAGLAPLFDGLRRRGFLDKAIVVVTADHGEEFREHGQLGHGTSLYDEQLRVPLLIRAPGARPNVVVDGPVSLIDVAPTLLDLLGLPREPRFEGRSLAATLGGASLPSADVLAVQLPVLLSRHELAFIRWPMKLLERRRRENSAGTELYDLETDPGELRDRPPARIAGEAPLVEASRAWQASLATRASAPERAVVSPETKEQLRALGYVH